MGKILVDRGWGVTDLADEDVDAQLFDAYLDAPDRDARERITRELARRGLLSGVRVTS